jgi:hypothetical protein
MHGADSTIWTDVGGQHSAVRRDNRLQRVHIAEIRPRFAFSMRRFGFNEV